MNKLSIIQKQNKWQPEVFFSTIAVDGIAFDKWLSDFIDKKPFDANDFDNVRDLALAFDLYDDEQRQLIWYWLGHLQADDSTLVPLLLCPDDMDFSCIMIVAEQFVTENTVVWKRFGRDIEDITKQDVDKIEWFNETADNLPMPSLSFDKNNFIEVFNALKEDIIQYNLKHGQCISIIFPADHERKPHLAKEDWELIVDSWYE